MPTYQYRCADCDHRFEVQQSFSDDALTECPECKGQLRKLFSAVGVVFKGSGFYRTDSASNGRKDKSSDSGGDKSSSSKSGSSDSSASSSSSSSSSKSTAASTS